MPAPAKRGLRVHRGYTLVELFVAIAILMILFGFLLGPISRARESARRVVCGSNLRQIGYALIGYSLENGGMFPPGNATLKPNFGADATFATATICPSYPQGLYMGIGILFKDGMLPPKVLYCPSWFHRWAMYDYVDPTPGGNSGTAPGGSYGGWPDKGHPGPTYFWEISYQYRSTFGAPTRWMPASANMGLISGNTAVAADMWLEGWGQFAHKTYYSVLFKDGHVEGKSDPKMLIAFPKVPYPVGAGSFGYANGAWTGFSWSDQETAWHTLFDH